MARKLITPQRKISRALLLIGATCILGCIEEKSEYTINPDLSGKATFELVFTPSHLGSGKPGDALEELVKPEIEKILWNSKGIETWKDISFELTDNGSVRFTGTAYFPNVNELHLSRPEVREGNRLMFSKDESGRITIELPHAPDTNDSMEPSSRLDLSEAELTRQIKLAKLRYNQVRPMMQAAFGTFEQEWFLYLPAKIARISNIEKVNDTTVHHKLVGREMLEHMDKVMADDEQLKLLILDGRNPFENGPDELFFDELFLHRDGPLQIVLSTDSADLFDYQSEVTAARNDYVRMLRELALSPVKPGQPPATPDRPEAPTVSRAPAVPGTVKVAGVQLVRYYDEERDIWPFHWNRGYTLSLVLELAEPNLVITHGLIEKATTDTGTNILPSDTWISAPKLSKDGKAALFEVNLYKPDEGAHGLAELSGVLVYLGSKGTREIDLGVMDFQKGAKGSVPGFYIRSLRPDYNKEYTRMELAVNLLVGTLKSTKFYREDGTALQTAERDNLSGEGRIGSDGSGNPIVFRSGVSFSRDKIMDVDYRIKGKFPPRGRIVLEVLDEVTRHKISFRLTNISLTGDPL